MSSETPARSPNPTERLPRHELALSLERLREENERLFREVARGEKRFRRLARAVWHVQEEEHRRIARELHDGLGQLLVALRERLRRLRETAVDSRAADEIAECASMTAEAIDQTRELSRLLRPTVLDDLGLEAALRWLVRRLRTESGIEVDLSTRGLDDRLDPDVETLSFRVVQEALTNVVKHAGVAQASVDVTVDRSELRIAVRDEGCGFDVQQVLTESDEDSGLGLRGLQDRVELVGGQARLETAPGEGTTLHACVPLGEAEESA